MRIAIVGGTGAFGRALAGRLREASYDVVIGSRDPARAEETANALGVDGATNGDAARTADLVVLATKASAALETARNLRAEIGTTPVLSVASELSFKPSGVSPADGAISIAEQIQKELDAPVAAGLHSLAASSLRGPVSPDEDALVCGDDPAAKAIVLEVAAHVTSGRVLDAGPLANARVLEGLTAVLCDLNRRYHAHTGLRISGLS